MDIKVGDFMVSKDLGSPNIFWNVTKVYTDNKGHTMIAVKCKNNLTGENHIPLLFLDKYYIKVDKTVATILFGKENEEKTDKSPKQ